MKPSHRGRACAPWVLALALAACASGSGGSGSGGSADTITQQQIDEAGLDSALEVVRRYRARWLQPTRAAPAFGAQPVAGRPGMPQSGGDGTTSEVYARVVRDGVPFGEIAALSSINSRTVASITFVSPSDARTRYGSGYEGGAIEVVSR